MAKNAQRILYRLALALPLALVILWQIAVETGWLSNRILPAPSAVLAAFEPEPKRRTVAASEHQQPARVDRLCHRRQHRADPRLYYRAVALGRTPAGQLGANDPQRAARR